MNQEDIQKALEAISKGGITVAGDLVLEKKVEYEVANVEAGGIGIQINHGKVDEAMTASDKDIKTCDCSPRSRSRASSARAAGCACCASPR